MRYHALIAWLIGLAGLAALLALNNGEAAFRAGIALREWLVVVLAFHAVPLAIDVTAWRWLFAARPGFGELAAIRWIAESVNGLFPVPHLGELLRVDMVRRLSSSQGEAASSVVVDITLGLGTQILFTVLGLLIYARVPGAAASLGALLAALAVLIALGVGLYLAQRGGFSLAVAALARLGPSLLSRVDLGAAGALEARIAKTYRRRRALLVATVWRFAGWIAGAGEIWLILQALGHPVSIADAIMIESLSQAARTAAFAIPGGLGMQDGALVLLCGQLGIGPDGALALALVKRFREAAIGLPGLIAGSIIQAKRRRRAA
jgi:putative membrane protein